MNAGDDGGRGVDDGATVPTGGKTVDTPGTDGTATRATAGDALFALALTRAEHYLRRARPPERADEVAILAALEPWLLRTRFASRVDARALARALAARLRAAAR